MGRKSKQRLYFYKAHYRNGIILLLVFLFLPAVGQAQADTLRYWVQFADKNHNPYSLSKPLEFLSQRALDRRAKQNIPLAQNDLPVTPAYVDSLRLIGAEIIHTSKWFNAATVMLPDTNLRIQIEQFSFVKGTEKVAKLGMPPKPEVADLPSISTIAHGKLSFDYGSAANQVEMLRTNILHDMGYTGEGMVIAVLDAGFLNVDEHEAFQHLRQEGKILGTWDFVEDNAAVYEDNSHGAIVLSIMAANLPGILVGTAPDASYWLLRSENAASEYLTEEDNWVAAAEFADSVGADIINSSLGYTTFDDTTQNHTYTDMDGNTARVTIGADIAASKGILVVNSAGNEGDDAWKFIGAPADGDSVLAVGAVNPEGEPSGFSSEGPTADGRVKPNVVAQGEGIASIGGFTGTSYAAPLISGSAAVLWQAFPHKTNMEIFRAIEQSAHLYPNFTYKMGYGIPNFVNAHHILLDNENVDTLSTPFVYPNPFFDVFYLYVRGLFNEEITIRIYGFQGFWHEQRFFTMEGTWNNIRMDVLQNQPAGYYIVEVETPFEKYHVPVIKMTR